MDATAIAAVNDVGEGLERRIAREARLAPDVNALIGALKCRRYTYARLKRILLGATIDLTKEFARARPEPAYARLLGARADAAPLLKALKARTRIPLIGNPRALRDDPVFALECRATDLWALARTEAGERAAGREFTEKFVMLP